MYNNFGQNKYHMIIMPNMWIQILIAKLFNTNFQVVASQEWNNNDFDVTLMIGLSQ